MDPMTNAKTYWSILKSLLNNKKIPCIPPLFHQNKYVTDFKKKAELFIYKNKSISTVTFTRGDIATLI